MINFEDWLGCDAKDHTTVLVRGDHSNAKKKTVFLSKRDRLTHTSIPK